MAQHCRCDYFAVDGTGVFCRPHTISAPLYYITPRCRCRWFNCFAVDGTGAFCDRLKFRTASFCNERSGHFDAFDQGISFFLPK